MKWSIKQIEDNSGLPLAISEVIDVKSSLMERESEIIDVSPVTLSGTLLYDNHSVIAMFQFHVIVTLPSSRSLEPVPYAMDIDVNERYVEADYLPYYADNMKAEIIMPLDSAMVDLREPVIDNILLSLPLQVLSEEEQNDSDLPKGEGWSLYTQDSYEAMKAKEAKETIDPRLAGLQSLLEQE